MIKYDKDLKETGNKTFEADEKGYTIHDVKQLGDRIIMFISKENKKDKNTTYYATIVNGLTLTVENNAELYEVEKGSKTGINIYQSFNDYWNPRNNGIAVSQDSSKFMICASMHKDNSKENDSYEFYVFDNKGNKLWNKNVVTQIPHCNNKMLQYFVTNDGKAGVIFRNYEKYYEEYDNVKYKESKGPIHQVKMVVLKGSEEEPKEYVINNNNLYQHAIEYAYEDLNDVYFLSREGVGVQANSTSYSLYTLSKTTRQLSIKKHESFSDEFLAQMKEEECGEKKGSDKGISRNFHYVKSVIRDNGSIDFLIQRYVGHVYSDIVDINLNTTGKTFIQRVPLTQLIGEYYNANQFGFVISKSGNNLNFIYTDLESNINRDINKCPKTVYLQAVHPFCISMATIDATGGLNRKMLYSNKSLPHSMSTAIEYCKPFGNNKILLLAQEFKGFYGPISIYDMIGQLEY